MLMTSTWQETILKTVCFLPNNFGLIKNIWSSHKVVGYKEKEFIQNLYKIVDHFLKLNSCLTYISFESVLLTMDCKRLVHYFDGGKNHSGIKKLNNIVIDNIIKSHCKPTR